MVISQWTFWNQVVVMEFFFKLLKKGKYLIIHLRQLSLNDNISRTQRELIQLQGNIDENQNNNRRLTPLQRRFSQKKTELDNLLKELYNLGEDDILIPKINESYGTD